MPALIAFLAFLTAAGLAYALLAAPPGPVKARLDDIQDLRLAGNRRQGKAAQRPPVAPQLLSRPLSGSLKVLDPFRRKLGRSGHNIPLSMFVTIWLMLVLLLPASFLALMLAAGMRMGGVAIVAVGATLLLALMLPNTWLNAQVRLRQRKVERALPDAIDLVTTCVEAGLGLDAALARVAAKTKGPLGEELVLVLRETAMGRRRRDALLDMARRLNVPDLTTFVNVIVQAEQLGVSVGQALRVEAQHLRQKRRQRAEEAAYKAPIKMIFPLVGFIFPSLFLVIMGPAAITLLRTVFNEGAK